VPVHPVNGPEEVDRRGARCGERAADDLEIGGECMERCGRAVLDAERDMVVMTVATCW
jgi:hypothetical protein